MGCVHGGVVSGGRLLDCCQWSVSLLSKILDSMLGRILIVISRSAPGCTQQYPYTSYRRTQKLHTIFRMV